jgi:hypothetical protein
VNKGINLLMPGAGPQISKWPGGEGLLAVGGQLSGAAVQVLWAPHIDAEFTPVGKLLRVSGQLSDPWNLPRGLLTVSVVDKTNDTFASATAYSMPTTVIRGSK